MMDDREQRRERAIDAYEREHRFRAIVQHIVHEGMQKRGIFNADELTYRPGDIARMMEDVAAQVLQAVYEEDAELKAQKHIADHFRKIAEDLIRLAPPRPFIKDPPAIGDGGDGVPVHYGRLGLNTKKARRGFPRRAS